ncbi:MAG: permease YjgP/YjgQ family protein [Bacteroidetes bacterium]|nr:permease YjgP/YjgQ family protein [Bacteroidota bacterium]
MLAYRYLLRAHIGPFVFSLCTLMFLFILQFVMKFIDQLIGKGLSAWIIIELIALSLAWMVVLAVPMSVLVATLMAFGELSSKNEITAMKASGMSMYRMLTPIIVASIVIAIVLVWFNNYVLPEANHQAKTLMIDIRKKKPTLNLVAGLFSQDISGYSILVRKIVENSNDLEGVTLYDYTNQNSNVVITAERGRISFSPDYRKIIMDLERGEIHELDLLKMSSYRRLRFQNHRIVMNAEGFEFERSSQDAYLRGDRELSAQVMIAIVDSLSRTTQGIRDNLHKTLMDDIDHQIKGIPRSTPFFATLPGNQPPAAATLIKLRSMSSYVASELSRIEFLDKQTDQYLVEIYKKYSIPAACIVFVLIGVPLGIMSRRGGFGAAATLSLGFFLMYWAFLIGGEKLADRDTIVSPFVGMWSANIVLGMFGIYLTIRIGRETVVIDWTLLQRLIPRRWRATLSDEPKIIAENP